MKYYIFRVKESAKQEYYVVNNMYLEYLGFDSNRLRGILERDAKISRKYQLFAKGNVIRDDILHREIFCKSERFDKKTAKNLSKQYNLKISKDKTWYEIFYPNPNSSEMKLKGKTKIFKG